MRQTEARTLDSVCLGTALRKLRLYRVREKERLGARLVLMTSHRHNVGPIWLQVTEAPLAQGIQYTVESTMCYAINSISGIGSELV